MKMSMAPVRHHYHLTKIGNAYKFLVSDARCNVVPTVAAVALLPSFGSLQLYGDEALYCDLLELQLAGIHNGILPNGCISDSFLDQEEI